MTKNPLINAGAAIAYIVLIASVMFYGTRNTPDNNFLAPVLALSVFTLSAAVMGYVFCYQPIILLLGGKKEEAVDLFLKTLAAFGVITGIVLLLFLSGILS